MQFELYNFFKRQQQTTIEGRTNPNNYSRFLAIWQTSDQNINQREKIFPPLALILPITYAFTPITLITMELATASGLFEPDQTDILAGMLRSPNVSDVWFTDDEDGIPVGVAYLAPEKMTRGTWNLYWIAVDPGHQRQGRGKAILDHVQKWLIENGQRMLLVETAGVADFDYVRKFYANLIASVLS